MKSKLIYLMVFLLATIACGGRKGARGSAQQNYETVDEGSASGVTSTILGPGETLPPITGTNADTTSNFALNPDAVPPPTMQALPPPMTSASSPVPQPAAPLPASQPQAQQPRPAPEPEPAAETTAPPATTTTTALEKPQEEPKEEPPPPADDTSGEQAEEPPPPPPQA